MESIDFMLVFPQTTVQMDIYMKPPYVPLDFAISDLPDPSDCFIKVYKLLHNFIWAF